MPSCPQCRVDNPDFATYCASCGSPLAARASSSPRQGLAIASLVLAVTSLPLAFCLIGILTAPLAVVLGIVAVVRANRQPAEYGGRGLAIGGIAVGALCLLFCIPVVAAIVIPSLLRARVSRNESAAIGDVRTVIAAEAAYASANGGFYDAPACLAAPRQCIPEYPESGAVFLDSRFVVLGSRSGYVRRFQGGPRPSPEEIKGALSPSSVKRFAFIAVPAERGRTGVRSFCGDDTGRLCQVMDGGEPRVQDGRCDPSCLDLR